MKAKEVKNKYNVPAKLWKSFKENQYLFNSVMRQMVNNQHLTTHPKSKKLPKEEWFTICWNASCYAVWAVKKQPLRKGEIVKHIDIKGKPAGTKKAK